MDDLARKLLHLARLRREQKARTFAALVVLRDALWKAERRSHKYIAKHPAKGGGYWYEYDRPGRGLMVDRRWGDHLPVTATALADKIPDLRSNDSVAWSPQTRMPSMKAMSDHDVMLRALDYAADPAPLYTVEQLGEALSEHVEPLSSFANHAWRGNSPATIGTQARGILNDLGLNAEQAIRLCGIPDGSEVWIAREHGALRVSGTRDGEEFILRRVRSKGSDAVEISNTAVANTGDSPIAWRNILTQALEAQALAPRLKTTIRTQAYGVFHQREQESGYLTWLCLGFRSVERLKGPHGEPIEQLAHSPNGRAWWLYEGGSWEALFDPADTYCTAALSAEVMRRKDQP